MTSLQGRTTLLLLGFLTLVLAVTLAAVMLSTLTNVRQQAADNLTVGARVFQELLTTREQQLANSAQILADDFAFREAVATEDQATIESALSNHGSRINADLMVLADSQNAILASVLRNDNAIADFEALRTALQANRETGVLTLDQGAYQWVTAVVRAPLPIARVVMGFRVDDRLAHDLQRLTGLHVTFLKQRPQLQVHASTLPKQERQHLLEDVATPIAANAVTTLQLGDNRHLSRLQTLSSDDQTAQALLQTSLAEAMAPFNSLWWRLGIIAAGALLLSLLIAGLLARHISRPIHALATAAARISKGDYQVATPRHGIRELSQLGEAFDAMQHGIQEREQRLVDQAYHDQLTGLPNRTLIASHLEAALAAGHSAVMVLAIDIVRFREINDSLGQHVGDAVLLELARRLRQQSGPDDFAARLGADEFLLISPSADGQAQARARQLLSALIAEAFEVGEARLELDLTMGLAIGPADGDAAETLLRRADIAKHEAKAQHVHLQQYRRGRDEAHQRRLQMLADLRQAVDQGAFSLNFQPKVGLNDRRPFQVEALLRWQHPEHGPVSPAEFIPLAEQTGYIRDISRWVLQAVLAQLRAWRDQGIHLGVSVNLSALDLADAELPTRVARLLAEHQVPASALTLEITETTVMRDTRHAQAVLGELQQLGATISIDDFGTGFSSLAQLRTLPVDELKIDKSFVLHLASQAEDDEDPVIVRSTIELGHNMGLRVVAEGIEDEATWWRLQRYGCDAAQGFWIARPMAAEAIPGWLTEFAKRRWSER